MDVYETLVREGENVAEIDGKIVDIYEYRRARKILQWAEACVAKDRDKKRAFTKAQSEIE